MRPIQTRIEGFTLQLGGFFDVDAVENTIPYVPRLAEHLVKAAATDLAVQIALRLLDADKGSSDACNNWTGRRSAFQKSP